MSVLLRAAVKLLSLVAVFSFVLAPLVSVRSALAEEPRATFTLPKMLTLKRALNILKTQGLQLYLADAEVERSTGELRVAKSVANPDVIGLVGKSFTYHPTAESCPGGGCTEFSWMALLTDNAALTDVLFSKRAKRMQVAKAALDAAKHSRADALRQLEFGLKNKYMEVAFAEAYLSFVREVLSVYTQLYKLTTIREKAGAISHAEVAKADTARLGVQKDVIGAEQNVRQAKADLAYLLGVRGAVGVFDIERKMLDYTPAPTTLDRPIQEILNDAYANRLDLKALQSRVKSFAFAVESTKQLKIPAVAINVQALGQGVGLYAVQPPTVLAGLSVPLPIFNQYQGDIEKSEAGMRVAKIEELKLRAAIAMEVETADAAFEAARKKIQLMQGQLLQRAEESKTLTEIQYKKGAASLLEFLDAERTWIASKIEYLDNLADYWVAVFRVEQAVGKDLWSYR